MRGPARAGGWGPHYPTQAKTRCKVPRHPLQNVMELNTKTRLSGECDSRLGKRGETHKSRGELCPIGENPLRARAGGLFGVQLNELMQLFGRLPVELRERLRSAKAGVVAGMRGEGSIFVEDLGQPTRHARAKVLTGGTQHDYQTARHVLAAMVSNTFHHRQGPGVAHGKALARAPGSKKRAAGCTIKRDISENDVQLAFACSTALPAQDQLSSAQAFADKIVGHAFQNQLHPGHGKCSKGLPGNALHLEVQRSVLVVQS